MTGINVPELIKTTIHRLSHPKGYADLIKDYIKRAKEHTAELMVRCFLMLLEREVSIE